MTICYINHGGAYIVFRAMECSCCGALSSTTALFWAWGHKTGRLREPPEAGVEPEEVELHGKPTV